MCVVAITVAVFDAPSQADSSQVITPAPAFSGAELTAHPGDDWISVGGNLPNSRYSQLSQIDKSNVAKLKVAWSVHLDGSCATSPACSGEGNALAYKGILYTVTGADAVFALDGATGQRIWGYVPSSVSLKPGGDPNIRGLEGVSRGIAMGEGKIFVGQNDGKLVALDQMTGGVVWQNQTAPTNLAYKITAAPVYYDGLVIMGMSGGDSGNRDFLAAYDASTGVLAWIWYVIPGPGDPGYDTWGGKSLWHVGGGAIFDSPIVDPKTGTVFVGTGNQVPWNSRPAGKELYADSIVALNAHTGKVKWAYQTVHHDVWDDDLPAPGVLTEGNYRDYKILKAGTWVDNPAKGWSGSHAVGTKVKYTSKPKHHLAVVYAAKQGYTFILDRTTGKPLIPTPEMKVDQTNAKGMNLWPTQPIPIGDYWAAQCVLPTQWTKPAPDAKPVKHGCAYTPVNTDQFVAIPHDEGEWMPTAYYPPTNTITTCIIDNRAWAMEAIPVAQQAATLRPGAGYLGILLTQGERSGYTGRITNQNVVTNKTVWHKDWPDFCYSGTVTTKTGLMFVGHNDGSLEAYDVTNGKSLWRGPTFPSGANAPAMIYSVNGKQYISILVAGNQHEQVPRGDLQVTYALP